jgi:exonuclease SbcC
MHITRVELENIKSHVDATFEFTRGTTAISGANGAGKTTLIEAIAWTLFDVLDYKKEDFLRRGARRGTARVTFESGLDERLYTVYRDTATGYNVYDPVLKMRVADKKEEVTRFLWQHMGVDPGTDLDSLYRRAIGVPQGTFTAIFLETAAERKKAFDKLLKVEEYRRSAEELLRTARFIEQQTAAVRENIARFEGEIARVETVEEEHRTIAARVLELGRSVDEAAAAVDQKQRLVEKLDVAESALNEARRKFERSQNEQRELSFALRQAERDLGLSKEAAARIETVKPDFERHASAVLRLRELERERVEREKLRNELTKVESALAAVRADEKHVKEALTAALSAHASIGELRSVAADQERLETELAGLRTAAAQAGTIGNQIAALDEKIGRLRDDYRANNAKLTEALARSKDVGSLASLEKRDAEIVRQLASLRAALERDERFQKEIKDGLCPILSQKCLNLKQGETLDDFVTSQFSELRTSITQLETEYGKNSAALRGSREAEKFHAQLDLLRSREKEIENEGKRLREERAPLQQQLDALPRIEDKLTEAEASLKALENPKGKIQLLDSAAAREGELRRKVSDIESNLERLESDRRIHTEQLESYKDFDTQWAEQAAIRDATAEADRIYLANETAAKEVARREKEFESAKKDLEASEKRLAVARGALESADKNYDRQLHAVERAALLELQKRHAELRATHESAARREKELADELGRLSEIKRSIETEFREKERLEKMAELTAFIRDTLKEAAPLVARNYVYHVSVEASQMFREITGNAEHTLKWGEDYAVSLEEGGYDRPFQSLSGGEQMAAALSVRLALLKQLTDLRIAFFDEPTSNLDYERRENLAMQISQIKHFDQLFVISHDDTFEGYVENVVTIERGEENELQALQQTL